MELTHKTGTITLWDGQIINQTVGKNLLTRKERHNEDVIPKEREAELELDALGLTWRE